MSGVHNIKVFVAIKKIAPALATGNSIVLKPSELAPVTVLEVGSFSLTGISLSYTMYACVSWLLYLLNVVFLQVEVMENISCKTHFN